MSDNSEFCQAENEPREGADRSRSPKWLFTMAETGVHDARNGRSRSAKSVFTIERNGCSSWSETGVHDGPKRAINERRKEGQIYLEPFCGGGAVLCKVDDRGPRAASDTFAPIIDLMEALQEGEMPPKFVSRRAHNQARAYLCELLGAKTYAEAIRRSDTLKQGDLPVSYIWAVLAGSFDGVWMDSYAKKTTKGVIPSTERYNILRDRLKEMPGGIENVEFFHRDYRDWLPRDAVIYCDPPYFETKKYREGSFDTDEFWYLMDIWRQDRTNKVLVSERIDACPLPGVEFLFDYRAGKRKERLETLFFL